MQLALCTCCIHAWQSCDKLLPGAADSVGMSAVNLQYMYPFELYMADGRHITPNTCSVESGTNDDGCRIKYGVFPQLPPGLALGT